MILAKHTLKFGVSIRVVEMVVSSDPLIVTGAEDVAFMMKSLGVDEKRIKEAVADLQEWIDRSPHLPKVSDPRLLCTLWFRRKCSIERAKESIDTYYSVRGLVPEFFENRNLSSPDLKQAVKNIVEVEWERFKNSLVGAAEEVQVGGQVIRGSGRIPASVAWLANTLVVLSSTAEDGEIEVQISVR
ncbi:unnamed protein product [Timema podura]|uniref:Uncharacterized protein n=1 Tax=Timema podura TaxID=61482 RepID=A0ABN7NQI0_TIMPD|nr:unnamed protein product [Timema podura]